MLDPKTNEWFIKNNLTPPTHQAHLRDDEIENHMEKLMPNKWRLEGNLLIGETKFGPVANFIPTNYICRGTGDDGLPILEKLDI